MYSDYRLEVELMSNRKIMDIRSHYQIKVHAVNDLEKAFGDYAHKFYLAAHEIASLLLETDKPDIAKLDTYFFPLAFLYRHSIELLLKGIAFQKIIIKADRENFAKDTFHDLDKILTTILEIYTPNRPEEELEWLKKYLKDISQKDKESDSFRYPFHIRRDRDPIYGVQFSILRVFDEQTHIDLIKFANKFEAAYEILKLWYNNSTKAASEWKSLTPVFLESGGHYYGQSVVGYGFRRQDFYPYLDAYVETAGFLREAMKSATDNGSYSTQETFFLPMCYLYRNSVELAIKEAWFEETREDFQIRCKALCKKKHSIIGLWNDLRRWIVSFYDENDQTQAYFDDIEKCCNELHNFDCDASKFRYPCTKHMDENFKRDTMFDYINVAEFMESLIQAIDCISWELSARNEYFDEREAEMRAEIDMEY